MITTLKTELAALLMELEEQAAQHPRNRDRYRTAELLRAVRNDRFYNALATTPELRAWVDRIVSQLAQSEVSGD